jgi:hypothetical protein
LPLELARRDEGVDNGQAPAHEREVLVQLGLVEQHEAACAMMPPGMLTWTPLERRWGRDLLAAMIPANPDAALPGLGEVDLGSFWQRYERTAPPLLRFGFRFSVASLTLLGPALVGKATMFGRLTAAERDEVLRRAASSRFYVVRQLVTTVKLMACLGYFGDERVRERLGGTGGAS